MPASPANRPAANDAALSLLSIVIPARDEADSITATLRHLSLELKLKQVPHEILVVDDGSYDATWQILVELGQSLPELKAVKNEGDHGFGRAVVRGIDASQGDAIAVMMADESDDPRDVVLYWERLCEGWDAVFGSRFMSGGGAIDYPKGKWVANRMINLLIRILFQHGFNDTTNAFKAYRRSAIDGCRPFLSPHFNLTVEIPLKIVIRGYSWTTMPITWRNRRAGEAKLKLKEMGSRYLFIILYCWLEKYFSRNDYTKP